MADYILERRCRSMYDEIRVLTHSSIKISGTSTIYVDPFKIKDALTDADIILITHEHYDHFSPEDIKKVQNGSTVFVAPQSMIGKLEDAGIESEFIEYVEPGDELEISGITIKAVPAYNVLKNFHPKKNCWVGYLVTMNGISCYVAGDTDINEDVEKVRCDVALLPCGGTYTMDVREAALLAEIIKPKLAIPTHYGNVAGDPEDGDRFVELLKGKVKAEIRMEY